MPVQRPDFVIDFIELIYPNICQACGTSLRIGESVICLRCIYKLPETDFHLFPGNAVEKHFWARIPLQRATALCFFEKGNMVQKLLHRLKYQGRREIGVRFGQLLGAKLKNAEGFGDISMIVPVPLHPAKLKKRGFNQSDYFAQGLSMAMQVPFYPDVLKRVVANISQTKKDRYQRWGNVANIFQLTGSVAIAGQHILLVDDVITTGATLEASASALLQEDNVRLSIATIACAV